MVAKVSGDHPRLGAALEWAEMMMELFTEELEGTMWSGSRSPLNGRVRHLDGTHMPKDFRQTAHYRNLSGARVARFRDTVCRCPARQALSWLT